MPKRVLIITETGHVYPSNLIRALLYKDLFVADGIQPDYVSRRAPWIVRLMEQPGRLSNVLLHMGLGFILRRLDNYLTRIREDHIIRRAGNDYDAIYIQKVPSWPLISALRHDRRSRLVFDLNDGLWLPAHAAWCDGKVEEILKTVDAVTCDNPHGIAFARRYNQNVFLVPDSPQLELFDQYRNRTAKPDSPVVLGWVGSPSAVFNLYSIWEPLERLFAAEQNIVLRLVGAGRNPSLIPRFEKVRYSVMPFYSQLDMVREVLNMDIGLFPMFDVEDSLARGMLKAIVYMSGEAAVVTPPIGQNRELITDGENGLFATTAGEWLETMTRLVEDADLRRRIALSGLRTVRENFTLRRCYDHLRRALNV